jgi:co-chaperonin GroES (HSP10)
MTKIVPLGDQVIVRVEKKPEFSAGGIALPSEAVEESVTGIVVTPNPESYYRDGTLRSQSQVRAGDKVVFAKKSGTKVLHGPAGLDLLAIPEDCIYYIVESSYERT